MAGTLTLSRVEQAAVLRHLELQYRRVCDQAPRHPDCQVLHKVMTRLGHNHVIGLTPLEALVMLRHLRFQHRRLDDDMLALEERRLRGGIDGVVGETHRALDTEATILADVLRRLWDIVT